MLIIIFKNPSQLPFLSIHLSQGNSFILGKKRPVLREVKIHSGRREVTPHIPQGQVSLHPGRFVQPSPQLPSRLHLAFSFHRDLVSSIMLIFPWEDIYQSYCIFKNSHIYKTPHPWRKLSSVLTSTPNTKYYFLVLTINEKPESQRSHGTCASSHNLGSSE